ncbi:unnamed protein product [Trichobilharzia regenti]|nr:unnamed protein product [Trichobilharzia regenti]
MVFGQPVPLDLNKLKEDDVIQQVSSPLWPTSMTTVLQMGGATPNICDDLRITVNCRVNEYSVTTDERQVVCNSLFDLKTSF